VARRLIALLSLVACSVAAQTGGGLYVAGGGFDFGKVGDRALAQNPQSRFFLLVVGDAIRYLALTAPPELVDVRNRIARGNVVFLVCQRDLEAGTYRLGDLVPGVVPVKGWPPPDMPNKLSGNYYPDEEPGQLPTATEALRRLRSTCS
jgi:hypothetical protein